MNKTLSCLVAFATVVVTVGCVSSAGRLRAEVPENAITDASILYRVGEAAAAVYSTDPMATKVFDGLTPKFGWETQVLDLPETSGRVFIMTNHDQERQLVVSRGTANKANIWLDLSYSKVLDKGLNAYLHKGFREAAIETWEAVQPLLNPDYSISFTGHSLGGAIAVICGMGAVYHEFDVEAVITFGQPKVTNQAGAEYWDADMELPLMRVVHGTDSVTVLPFVKPSDIWQHGAFWHFGVMIHIDDEGKYEILSSAGARLSGHNDYWEQIFTGDRTPLAGLFSHPMQGYLDCLWQWIPKELYLHDSE